MWLCVCFLGKIVISSSRQIKAGPGAASIFVAPHPPSPPMLQPCIYLFEDDEVKPTELVLWQREGMKGIWCVIVNNSGVQQFPVVFEEEGKELDDSHSFKMRKSREKGNKNVYYTT